MHACKNLLADDGGRVVVFSTNICSKGVGMLKSRDKVNIYNTDEEKNPDNNSDIFANELDFISIGTNDLIQYTIAADRTNETLGDIISPYQPSVLRMLRLISNEIPEGTYVSICGEMANDVNCLPIFIAMGVRELSMNYYSIPKIKGVIHDLSFKDCNEAFKQCLKYTCPKKVKKELTDLIKNKMPSYSSIINYEI